MVKRLNPEGRARRRAQSCTDLIPAKSEKWQEFGSVLHSLHAPTATTRRRRVERLRAYIGPIRPFLLRESELRILAFLLWRPVNKTTGWKTFYRSASVFSCKLFAISCFEFEYPRTMFKLVMVVEHRIVGRSVHPHSVDDFAPTLS